MSIELGGFAEFENEIDGDFNAFNFCLAEDYASAIYCEDFEALGEISWDVIDKITYWLNYDGEIGKNYLNEIEGIRNGNIITFNNRTFIDAIVAHKNYQFAETYIFRGIFNEHLFTTYIMNAPDSERCFGILTYITYNCHMNKEKYVNLLNSIFKNIDEEFKEIDNSEQQLLFLNRMKNVINSTKYPAEYGKVSISVKEYNWAKQLVKLNKPYK